MALHIVFLDDRTEDVSGVDDFAIHSSHLRMWDADGNLIGEREAVARAWQMRLAD